MEPIISPWLIYLFGLIDNVSGVLTFIVIMGALCLIALWAFRIYGHFEDFDHDEDVNWEKFKKWVRRSTVTIGIMAILAIVMPSRNTVIGMCVADAITHDVAGDIIEAGKDVKNELKKDIIEIIEFITKDKDSGE